MNHRMLCTVFMAKRGPKSMTDDHKAAIVAGRNESRAINQYLKALEDQKPRRGRRRTPESIAKRLDVIAQELPESTGIAKLGLVQEQIDLQNELESMNQVVDISELEASFIEHAQPYGERKGVSYMAWREVGVPAAVLQKANITRAGS